MTSLEDILDRAVRSAREEKERVARKRFTDLSTSLFGFRGEDLVAMVVPDKIDRDDMLRAARLMAAGMGVDVLAVTFETFQSELRDNPITGKKWGQREMQLVAEQHDGVTKGWVSDALMVCCYNRAGDNAARSLPYRVVGKHVAWRDEKPVDHWGGYVDEALTAAMQAAPLDVTMARMGLDTGRDFGLTADDALAHRDCAVAKMFSGELPVPGTPRCTVALGAEPGTARERIIRRSFPGGTVLRG